jgi:hypothetical protein
MARRILDGTFLKFEHGYVSIIGPQPTASSYRMYNTYAKNACRNAFRKDVRENLWLGSRIKVMQAYSHAKN